MFCQQTKQPRRGRRPHLCDGTGESCGPQNKAKYLVTCDHAIQYAKRSFFPYLFFRGGEFFKIEWAETGRGLFVLYNTIVLKNNSRYTKTVDMSNSAKKLGDNIRRIRLAKDLTQGDLCRKLGLDRAYMSNVESGKKNPTLSTITNIAKALDVSVDELLK